MPIDFSQPGYKEMLANYALTAMAALSLEKPLLLLVVAIDHPGNGSLSKEKLYEYLEKSGSGKPMKKKSMGELIREVKMRIVLPQHLEIELKKAIDLRNYITHYFLIDEYETLRLPSGPDTLSNKLRSMNDLFNRLRLDGVVTR